MAPATGGIGITCQAIKTYDDHKEVTNVLKIVMYVLNNFTFDARVHREAQSLAEAGHEVTVVALKDEGTLASEETSGYKIERLELKTRGWPKKGFFQIFKYIEFLYKAFRKTKAIKPDICHGNDMTGLLPAFIGSFFTGAKVVYDSHELWLETNAIRKRGGLEMKVWAFLEKWLIKRADQVLTVSPWIADELAVKYDIPRPEVIMNCPPYEEVPESQLIRDKLGIAEDQVIVLHHGAMSKRRGIEEFIQSANYLPDNYKLVLLGPDSAFKAEQKEAVQKEGMADKVFFMDPVPVDEVVKHVASADIGTFLSAGNIKSHRLGLANKVFECMTAGTPLVVSDFFEAFVRENGIGISCDQQNPQDLARAILELWGDREFYQAAKANCLEKARTVYNWQAQAKKLEALYIALVSGVHIAKARG